MVHIAPKQKRPLFDLFGSKIVPNDRKVRQFGSKVFNWAYWAYWTPRICPELCKKLSERAEIYRWSPTSPPCDSAEMQATRIVLLSSELQKRLSQFLARICVFAGIKYSHKLYFGRPVCVACHGLTAKVFFWHEPLWTLVTFLSLHQIMRIESQPMVDCV